MNDRESPVPETVNSEQEDDGAQAQTVAEEAIACATSVLGEQDLGVRAQGQGDNSGSMPDLVDHMKQMVSSGVIDMSAYRGERNDDDEEGLLGQSGEDD